MSDTETQTPRQRWLRLLARATPDDLDSIRRALGEELNYVALRPAETGLVMVRGRAGGTGQRFNLGELTVTRAAVRLEMDTPGCGTVGHGYTTGRDHAKATQIAVLDALLQTGSRQSVIEPHLVTIEQRLTADTQTRQTKAAATRVEFSTLAREAS